MTKGFSDGTVVARADVQTNIGLTRDPDEYSYRQGPFDMHKSYRILTLMLIAIFMTTSLPNSSARAAPSRTLANKVSIDLTTQSRVLRTGKVKVVVQFNTGAGMNIDLVLANTGAKVTRRLNAMNMRVLELPLSAVEALAA